MNTLLIITLLLTGIAGFIIMLRKDRRIKKLRENYLSEAFENRQLTEKLGQLQWNLKFTTKWRDNWKNAAMANSKALNENSEDFDRMLNSISEQHKAIKSLQNERNEMAYNLNVFEHKINNNKILVFCETKKVWGTVNQSKDFLLNSKGNVFEKAAKKDVKKEHPIITSKEHIKGTKIRLLNEIQSKRVQQKYFDLGFGYFPSFDKRIRTDIAWLFVDERGLMTWTPNENYKGKAKEVTLKDLGL